MSRPILLAACLTVGLGAATACEPSPVVPTADERQNSESSRIEGQLIVAGTARGNAVLLLFAAERPPPPQGTGRPIAFTVVRSEAIFGAQKDDATHTGPFTAPFAFDLVTEGRYLVRGFIDREGCVPNIGCRKSDFLPWFGVTSEPNAGDVGGAAVDPVTRQSRVIEIARGEDGALKAATDVHVSFAQTETVPVDRPSFRVVGSPTLDLTAPLSLYKLVSEPIDQGVVKQTAPAFLVRWVDDDADGVPDDANGDGVPEVWPKLFVRKLSDGGTGLLDENDLDKDGVLDETGEDYERADGKKDGLPDAVVLAAGLLPDPLLPLLTNEDGTPKMTPVPVNALDFAIRPLALDARDPKAPVPLKRVPPGRYAVIVLNFTGQSWRVPNDLSPLIAEGAGLPQVESQAFVLEVK